MLRFDTPESQAAETLGVSGETLKRWRLKGKLPPHVFTKFGYKSVRYCRELLLDWQLNPDDPEAQSRSIEALQNSLPSNQPQKRGRKAA